MDLKLIKSIKLSLLKKDSDIIDNKATYMRLASVTFDLAKTELSENEILEILINIYGDLLEAKEKNKIDSDYLGLFLNYNNIVYENSILLETLLDIEKYSNNEYQPIIEFLKMTIHEN